MKSHYGNCQLGDRCSCDEQDNFPASSDADETPPVESFPAVESPALTGVLDSMATGGSWTQQEAVAVARVFESIAPEFGCHIGLTGGCLYRDGERKDCDILVYRIRQVETINIEGLLSKLCEIGLEVHAGFGFCYKCSWRGKDMDILIPEEPGNGNAYQNTEEFVPVSDGMEALL